MSSFNIFRGTILVAAVISVAACSTDGLGLNALGSGSGLSTSALQLGVTGDGGVTSTLGVASLTDPALGTSGLLGGGSDGIIGGLLSSAPLSPLSTAVSPTADQMASTLPLSTVSDSAPALGVDGSGGLTSDLLGQDPLTGVVGTDGMVADVSGGGNDGQVGDVVPAGAVPALPIPSTDTIGGLTDGTDPVSTLTSTLPVDATNPTGSLTDVTGLTDTLTSATGSTSPTDLVGIVTTVADPSTVTSLVSN